RVVRHNAVFVGSAPRGVILDHEGYHRGIGVQSRPPWLKLDIKGTVNRDLLAVSSGIKPDRHSWLEARPITLQIEAKAQCIAIVITNGTFGLPRRERAQRAQLSDQSWRLLCRA